MNSRNVLNRTTRTITSAGLAFALTFALVGCSGTGAGISSAASASGSGSAAVVATSTAVASTTATVSTADLSALTGLEAVTITGLDITDQFTDRDLAGTWEASEAVSVTLADGASTADGSAVSVDGNTVTITAEGTYVLTGSLTNGQIVVDVDDSSKVQLVLDGVTISNDTLAAIYVANADKVFVTAAEGSENALSTSGTVAQDGDDSVDATIYSHDDLVLNGTGSLTVSAAASHGIASGDDLKVVNLTLTVAAGDQGLRANDSIRVTGATLTVTSTDDAIHADSGDEAGYVYIQDGNLVLASGDDGIHADGVLLVCGGTIDVTESYEGLEGQVIGIAGGTVGVTASDDGFNAATSSADAQEMSWGFDGDSARGFQQFGGMMDADASCYLVISGGVVTVDAAGDGLDSNGYLKVTGGEVYVYGPTNDGNGALDSGVTASITGGTVIAAGSTGMAETFDADSTQCSALVGLSGSAGDTITVSDASGTVIASTTVSKSYACVVVSSPAMVQGETYTISNGSFDVEIELTSVSVTSGVTGGMTGGFGGMGGQGGPAGEAGDFPGEAGGDFGGPGGGQGGPGMGDGPRG